MFTGPSIAPQGRPRRLPQACRPPVRASPPRPSVRVACYRLTAVQQALPAAYYNPLIEDEGFAHGSGFGKGEGMVAGDREYTIVVSALT